MTDRDHARAVHEAALALNAAITAASRDGLRVLVEVDDLQAYDDDWPRPALRVEVARPVSPEEEAS